THENVQQWPSNFTAMGIIVNRRTIPHWDGKAWHACLDLLASVGTHKWAVLLLDDLQMELGYCPGTLVGIWGRVLEHSCDAWEGGERICIAHYMRSAV
ncbi:hypothetical protein BKA93DRAFT_703213, partial [Sparassis latifolia]